MFKHQIWTETFKYNINYVIVKKYILFFSHQVTNFYTLNHENNIHTIPIA